MEEVSLVRHISLLFVLGQLTITSPILFNIPLTAWAFLRSLLNQFIARQLLSLLDARIRPNFFVSLRESMQQGILYL